VSVAGAEHHLVPDLQNLTELMCSAASEISLALGREVGRAASYEQAERLRAPRA
jgi:hypothetical protein